MAGPSPYSSGPWAALTQSYLIPTLELESVWSAEDLLTWRLPWAALADSVGAPVVARPEFLLPWIRHRCHGDQFVAFGVWEGPRLVGFLPLLLTQRRMGGLRIRLAYYPTRNAFVPGVTALIEAETDSNGQPLREIADLLVGAVLDLDGWDLLELNSLPPRGVFETALRMGLYRRGMDAVLSRNDLGVRVDLTGGRAGILSRCDAGRRRHLNHTLDDLEARGQEITEISSTEQVFAGLAAAFEVAEASWQGRNQTSIASAEEARRFYRELSLDLAADGELSLWLLSAGSRPIAFDYHIVSGNRAFNLKRGFLPEYARLGPGITLLGASMIALGERGIGSMELFHPANDDKRRWRPEMTRYSVIRVFADTPRGRMLSAMQGIKRALHFSPWRLR